MSEERLLDCSTDCAEATVRIRRNMNRAYRVLTSRRIPGDPEGVSKSGCHVPAHRELGFQSNVNAVPAVREHSVRRARLLNALSSRQIMKARRGSAWNDVSHSQLSTLAFSSVG